MNIMIKKIGYIALIAIALISIVAFIWKYADFTKPNGDIDVSLTVPETMASVTSIIALEKGFFKNEGLNVSVNYVASGKIATDDLLGGKTNFATITETNLAFAGFNNPQIKIVCNIQTLNDATIVARRDRGINTPADLKGKKLGLILATSSQIYADRFMEKYGLVGKVEIVNLLPLATQSAIVEGSGVDAISVFQPLIHNAEKALGGNAILFRESELFKGYMNLAGKGDFISENEGVLEKMLKAYIRAEQFLVSNKTESIEIIAKTVKVDKEVVEKIWHEYEFKVSMNKKLLYTTTERGKWIIATQRDFHARQMPDYSLFFDDSHLRKIDAHRVEW